MTLEQRHRECAMRCGNLSNSLEESDNLAAPVGANQPPVQRQVMRDDIIQRRDFLTRSGITSAVVLASGFSAADGQVSPPSAAANTTPRVADLVLRNGKIITVDASFTIARAIAIAGDRIIAVGSDAEMTPHPNPGTKALDLN